MTEPTSPAGRANQMSKVWTGSGQPFPIDVKQLAIEITKHREDPIAKVMPHDLEGIDGMLSKRTRGDWVISYDETVNVSGRINFTLAHEFGHYECHRQTRDKFSCGEGELLNDYTGETGQRIEREANIFASYLLMPADDFRRQLAGGQTVTVDALGTLAERYQTSLTATALKWLELTDDAAMLVVVRDEHVLWSFPSGLARRASAYLPSGTPVAASALERASRAQDSRNSVHVRPGVWHPSLEADESVIISDQYEQLVYILRFVGVRTVEHAEEVDTDAFDVMSDSSSGLKWTSR